MEDSNDWEFVGSTSTDSFKLNGIDIFKKKWVNTGITAKVIDPLYGASKDFTVWIIHHEGNKLPFDSLLSCDDWFLES
jgi:hypothetical protein